MVTSQQLQSYRCDEIVTCLVLLNINRNLDSRPYVAKGPFVPIKLPSFFTPYTKKAYLQATMFLPPIHEYFSPYDQDSIRYLKMMSRWGVLF